MAFIVIEGLDGAGKSTQMELLRGHLAARGVPHRSLHFPRTDAPYFGELIARFLRGELGALAQVDPYLVALLYAGDRRDAAGIIAQWLAQGQLVLLDRYVYSNIGFQCAKVADAQARARLREWILRLEFDHFGIPRPDLSLLLDVPFAFTAQRLAERRAGADPRHRPHARDIHEDDLDFQERVRGVYLQQAELDERFEVIPCTDGQGAMLSPEAIHGQIAARVDALIEARWAPPPGGPTGCPAP